MKGDLWGIEVYWFSADGWYSEW